MVNRLLKIFIYIAVFIGPAVLFAQPSFGTGLNDTTPIDQQTLLLASGGVVYAIHKLRESRKKNK